MKSKIFLAFVFALLVAPVTQAQNCARNDFCSTADKGDFDFRSQSSYAVLVPGDTARTSVVVYARQSTRILVCHDPVLGDVHYRIFETERVNRRRVQEVMKYEEQIPIYAKDQYGNPEQEMDPYSGQPMYDEFWNPVYKIEGYESLVNYDTVWITERVVEETAIFDSKRDQGFWEEDVDHTRKLVIEVVIPKGDRANQGCVSVLVGNKAITERGFRTY